MEKQEDILPENPIEVLLTVLGDYSHILKDNAKESPDDKELQAMIDRFSKANKEFEKTVQSDKWKPCGTDYTQNLISIFEALSQESRDVLLASISMYGDLISSGVQGENPDQMLVSFYNSVVNLYNDLAAIFSQLQGIDYRKTLQDMISDGYARYPECKVIIDSFQEQLAALKKDSAVLKFGTDFYEGLNPVEQEYFLGQFLQNYIFNTETALEQMEIEGNPANMEEKIRFVVAAKRLLHRILVASEGK